MNITYQGPPQAEPRALSYLEQLEKHFEVYLPGVKSEAKDFHDGLRIKTVHRLVSEFDLFPGTTEHQRRVRFFTPYTLLNQIDALNFSNENSIISEQIKEIIQRNCVRSLQLFVCNESFNISDFDLVLHPQSQTEFRFEAPANEEDLEENREWVASRPGHDDETFDNWHQITQLIRYGKLSIIL